MEGKMMECLIDGCARKARRRGWCDRHYQRWQKYGDPLGESDRGAVGSRYVDLVGYVIIKLPGHPEARDRGWGREHRIVAHDTYGPIPDGWHVHHINHDKQDNRPENLEVVDPVTHRHRHREVDDEHLSTLYSSGLTTVEVGELTGHHPAVVWKSLVRTGTPVRPPSKTSVDDARLVELHAQGDRAPRIASKLGVGVAIVRRRMKELGITPYPPGRPPGRTS